MTEERESLPPNWITVTVGELGEVITGNTPSKADPENYGQYIPLVKPPELTNRIVASAEDGLSKIGSEKARILPANSILVSCIGNLGKTALNSVPVAFNQQINAIVPFDGVEPKFVFYQVQSFSFAKQLEEQASATTISIVNKGKFQGIACNLAPQREQKRIVAKIEELFSELDKGIESLTIARQQLSAYRQSVLKHAFEGKFKDEPVCSLLAAPLCNGRSVKDRPGGFPVLRLTALKQGRIDLRESKEGDWTRETAKQFLVSAGDFFVARGNGSKQLVGIGGLVGDNPVEVAFPDTMIRLRLDTMRVDLRYFAMCWNSRIVRCQIERDARTTAGIYKINQDHISAFTMPVPPIEVQREIAARLETQLSATDSSIQEVDNDLLRANALRQSILKKAFSGQLVAQDTTDEPASALLARIRAEREESEPKKKRNDKNGKNAA